MKKLIFILALAASSFMAFAQDSVYVNQKDGSIAAFLISNVDSISFARKKATVTDYMLINGVKWATKNVAAPGTFAASPEATGSFYQWNSNTAWSATGALTGWNSSWNGGFTTPSASDTWASANDPSPAGYRVPTSAEQQSLLNTTYVTNTWTTQNGVYGRKFTDIANGNSIFVPVSGYLSNIDGALNSASSGNYWSSTAYNSIDAYILYFSSSNAYSYYYDGRANGLAVRPVAE